MSTREITLRYIVFAHHPYCEIDRTISIKFGRKSLHVCARCTGQYLVLMSYLVSAFGLGIRIHIPYYVTVLLPAPATIDWLTQTMRLRASTNALRLVTGGIFGLWLGVTVQQIVTFKAMELLFVVLEIIGYISVVLVLLKLKDGCIDEYLKPYEDFIDQYKQQRKGQSHANG